MAGGGGGRRAVWVVSDWLVVSVERENRDNSVEAVLAPDRAEIILNFLLDLAPGSRPSPTSALIVHNLTSNSGPVAKDFTAFAASYRFAAGSLADGVRCALA